jgi:predicted ATPase/DNA-binding CsgD family transcriptional regulator
MRANVGPGTGNLPAALTSFVGRRRELRQAKRLLSVARLLTLTGTGGVGKTRLALRVAAEVRRVFTDGVWLVELADLRDPQMLPNTVATALGLRASADPAAGLMEFIEDRHLLLVLDNCEHMVEECAVLVTKLLSASGQVRVLATSRHVLRAEGEHILHLEPMAVPRGTDESTDAVTLFAERAAAVLPDFELNPGNLAVVVRICERLEGIPLALELAAVRLRMLSADELLHRLDSRFALLASGSRGARPSQRTLEATIDWSFGLCSPEEQRMWVRMSVFPGGFDLEAAGHVRGPDEGGATVLDIVAGLVDKSIVIRQNGTFGWHGWYRMLETVREYGEAKLAESGEGHEVRARQVEHYVDLTRRYREEGFGPRQLEWLGRLRGEHANIRAVLRHCLAAPERSCHALEIASSLFSFWFGGGLVIEGYRHLRRALEHCDERTARRARALYAASFLAINTKEAGAARPELAELAELAGDDERLLAGHAECLGMAAVFAGDLPRGTELLERALAGYRTAGDVQLEFDTLILLAGAYFFLDDREGAAVAEEALALTERHEARWSKGYALWAVAIQRWRVGQHREAANLLREAVGLRLPDRTLLALLLEALAWCRSSGGEYEQAVRLRGCANAVWRLSGARIGETGPFQEIDERCAGQARARLETAAFEAAFTEGSGFGIDEAIRYALGDKPTMPASAPARAGEPCGLTKRETEIAELVAQGMSNKAIADRLVIGRRTVETHVENILVKLGFTSRTQVAAWLTEHKRQSP